MRGLAGGLLSRDGVAGIAAILVGAVYLSFAYSIRRSALADAVGPGGVPRALGWLMIALGVILAVRAAAAGLRAAPDLGAEWRGQGYKLARAGGMLAIAIAYVATVGWLGYPLAITVAIIAVALFLGAEPSWHLVLVAIGGAAGLWAIFVLLLGVPMPSGALLGWIGSGR